MPQLNPAPWFMTMVAAWTIIIILMKLTLTNTRPTQAPSQNSLHTDTQHWPWMWQ